MGFRVQFYRSSHWIRQTEPTNWSLANLSGHSDVSLLCYLTAFACGDRQMGDCHPKAIPPMGQGQRTIEQESTGHQAYGA